MPDTNGRVYASLAPPTSAGRITASLVYPASSRIISSPIPEGRTIFASQVSPPGSVTIVSESLANGIPPGPPLETPDISEPNTPPHFRFIEGKNLKADFTDSPQTKYGGLSQRQISGLGTPARTLSPSASQSSAVIYYGVGSSSTSRGLTSLASPSQRSPGTVWTHGSSSVSGIAPRRGVLQEFLARNLLATTMQPPRRPVEETSQSTPTTLRAPSPPIRRTPAPATPWAQPGPESRAVSPPPAVPGASLARRPSFSAVASPYKRGRQSSMQLPPRASQPGGQIRAYSSPPQRFLTIVQTTYGVPPLQPLPTSVQTVQSAVVPVQTPVALSPPKHAEAPRGNLADMKRAYSAPAQRFLSFAPPGGAAGPTMYQQPLLLSAVRDVEANEVQALRQLLETERRDHAAKLAALQQELEAQRAVIAQTAMQLEGVKHGRQSAEQQQQQLDHILRGLESGVPSSARGSPQRSDVIYRPQVPGGRTSSQLSSAMATPTRQLSPSPSKSAAVIYYGSQGLPTPQLRSPRLAVQSHGSFSASGIAPRGVLQDFLSRAAAVKPKPQPQPLKPAQVFPRSPLPSQPVAVHRAQIPAAQPGVASRSSSPPAAVAVSTSVSPVRPESPISAVAALSRQPSGLVPSRQYSARIVNTVTTPMTSSTPLATTWTLSSAC
eukprot:TRINITY_DN15786_c0_g1_i4.p1 TRINITY_DN15786_c0_g1~~TRINITY_DN15786_c0_g1_i4.p1  ORF type:complete len:723 (-),score=69.90 TRINITY_DN15786_c0_g1_i4:57-2048(-)